ncbi:MAG: hypothetical protein Q9169_008135 [Polycauliona sp. 2 TL-2023]
MSLASTNSLDSLAQMAPHIIIIDSLEPHPYRDLYHPMIRNEKAIAESHTSSHIIISDPIEPHPHRDLYHPMIRNEKAVAECHSKRLHRHTHRTLKSAARKIRSHLTITSGHRARDVEKDEARLLLERAKTHKLAINYNANASSQNLLLKRKQSSSTASTADDEEPQSGEVISVRSSFADYSMLKAAYANVVETRDHEDYEDVASKPLPMPMMKQYKKLSWGSGMEEYKQVLPKGGEKRVLLVWGKGIDEEVECVKRGKGGRKWWKGCGI